MAFLFFKIEQMVFLFSKKYAHKKNLQKYSEGFYV